MAWHARISASGIKRVIKCAGSLALVESLPRHLRRGSGEAARQGTAAHGLGERVLQDFLRDGIADVYEYLGGKVYLDANEDAFVYHRDQPQPDPTACDFKHCFEIDDDMCAAVAVYVELAHEIVNSIKDPEVLVERSFNLDWLRPDLGGTSDLTIYEFLGTLYVIDYKHGQGVVVEVDENEQMLTYALGMAQEVDWLFDKLVLIIVQPRAPHVEGGVRRFETTRERLEEFRDEVAQAYDKCMEAGEELAKATKGNPGPTPEGWAKEYLKAGDHCTFCDANGPLCPAMRQRIQEITRADFDDIDEDEECLTSQLPDQEEMVKNKEAAERIAEVLDWVPAIDRFIKAAKSLGFQHIVAGHRVPGHKLVEGRAIRKYVADETTIVARVTEGRQGFDIDRLYEPRKIKSPAQLEKVGPWVKRLVNGVQGEEGWAVEPLAMKGKGSLSLVPMSNPKPEVTLDPNSDFADVEEEE